MKQDELINKNQVITNSYFSNWGDYFCYPIALAMLPYVARVPGITPNIVSILAFFLTLIGSVLLFVNLPFHLLFAGLLLIVGFIGDHLDGQLARYKDMKSQVGDYLDKTLDVLKIFIISLSLSYAVYARSQNIIHIILGFAICFFFLFRYYIKLETMFAQINIDPLYLKKSLSKRMELVALMKKETSFSSISLTKNIRAFILRHRMLFILDEAEFAILIGIFAFLNRLDIALYVFAFGQLGWAIYRWIERGYQIHTNSPRLLWPMRK